MYAASRVRKVTRLYNLVSWEYNSSNIDMDMNREEINAILELYHRFTIKNKVMIDNILKSTERLRVAFSE